MTNARFGFCVVNVGAERALKAEIARLVPGARLAFSRPGLVTFKDDAADERFAAGSVIARVRGVSLGRAQSVEELKALAGPQAAVLHVFARDAGEDGPTPEDVAKADTVRAALAGDPRFVLDRAPRSGERVLDVIVAGEEPMFVGAHVHEPGRWAEAGGRVAVEVPEGTPSRAFRKMEEALAWSGVSPKQGSVAVELGAAPGGAALALARRGVRVVAIDPAEMDAGVLAFVGPGGARVAHVKKAAGALEPSDVPADATLLAMDMNLAPPVALRYFARLVQHAPKATHAILTLKTNDDAMLAAIPEHLARIAKLGWTDVRATKLPSNRSEICVVARRGSAKSGGKGGARGGQRGGRVRSDRGGGTRGGPVSRG